MPIRIITSWFHQALLVTFLSAVSATLTESSIHPPRTIPPSLYDAYTLGTIVPVVDCYFDGRHSIDQVAVFKSQEINTLIEKAQRREMSYYGMTDAYLYTLLDKYKSYIQGKTVGVIGSTTPWYESIILHYGGIPVTIDYNKIICEDGRIKTMTVKEYQEKPIKFDILLSISSIEHDGLGRYGDPLDPFGDIRAIREMKEMLVPDGMLFLSVPVGQDALYWNAHRQYGPLRLPLLLSQWKLIESSGFSESNFLDEGYRGHQPVFVLKPK